MYCLFTILSVLAAILLISVILRCYLIRKVRLMTFFDKVQLLQNACEPFGFLYNYSEDIFTATADAWQRKWGYTTLYDETAPLFHMIFDCEPVYFDYDGRTWLIEIWKGQYGINTGAEVGIYRADSLIPKSRRKNTVFSSVPDYAFPRITFRLYEKRNPLFTSCGRHWWLTGFRMGHFSRARSLHMPVCITFPNEDMMLAFTDSLLDMGYSRCDLSLWQHSVSFCFDVPKSAQPLQVKLWKRTWIQQQNRFLCSLYTFVTRPFDNTLDRLIYLSFCIPFLFRRLVMMAGAGKCRKRCCKYCREDTHEY